MDVVTRIDERGGWTILRVSGDVDLTSAPRFREQVLQVIADGHHRLVLDLNDVDVIDSTGLGVIVGALKRVRTLEGDLRLVSTGESLRALFELTSLDRAIPLAASVNDAIAASRLAGS